MGQSLSQRACLVRLVYLPSPTTDDVVARGSEIPAPRPTHPTAPHFYQRAFRAGTDLRRSPLGAVSARKPGVDRATRSRFAGVGRQWMLRCGTPRSREAWPGTDYEAGE